jgi:spermidine/putrescine ABC transporter ATP-binding subunit
MSDSTRPTLGITIRGLSKSYAGVDAISSLDLHLESGVFAAILGPSGSGKTTLLNVLAGLVSPTAGSIFVGARDVANLSPQERNIGLVFQNYALFPHMTVFENVAFPLRARRMKRSSSIASKVSEALSAVQLSGFDKRLPSELSGGQQQRVAIARALVFEPDLLLLDEPLGALDKQLREHMQIELRRLHQSIGVTTVFVTHDQEEAMSMADLVIVMQNGRIEQIGSPKEVYEKPANLFVAGFVGNLNCFKGRVLGSANGETAVQLDLGIVFKVRNSGSLGDDVVLGIRPDNIRVVPSSATEGNSLTGRVLGIRFLGSSQSLLVRLTGSETEVTVRCSVQQNVRIDEEIWLHMPCDQLLIFPSP